MAKRWPTVMVEAATSPHSAMAWTIGHAQVLAGQTGADQDDDQPVGPLGDADRCGEAGRLGARPDVGRERAEHQAQQGGRAAASAGRAGRSTSRSSRRPPRRRSGRTTSPGPRRTCDDRPLTRATAPSTRSSMTKPQTSIAPVNHAPAGEEDQRRGHRADRAEDGDGVGVTPAGASRIASGRTRFEEPARMNVQHGERCPFSSGDLDVAATAGTRRLTASAG